MVSDADRSGLKSAEREGSGGKALEKPLKEE